MSRGLDKTFEFIVKQSLFPFTKIEEVEPVALAEHILAALDWSKPPTPSNRSLIPSTFSDFSRSMTDLNLCGKQGGTISDDDEDSTAAANTLPSGASEETATTEDTEDSSSSNGFLPLLGLEEGVFRHSAQQSDKRSVLFINDVSVDLKVDSKLWDLFCILVTRAQKQNIIIFFTTNSKKVANQLYSINGGSKIVPLPCLSERCSEAEWRLAHSADEIKDVREHSTSDKLPNFTWKPFSFAEKDQFKLLSQKFPSLDHGTIRYEISSGISADVGLGGLVTTLTDIVEERNEQEAEAIVDDRNEQEAISQTGA